MAQNPEEVKNRLENIHAIKPLLTALRTISLANWKQAINKQELLKSYISNPKNIYIYLSSKLNQKPSAEIKPVETIIAIGSNRGLCGNFNRDIVDTINEIINESNQGKPKLLIFGDRLRKLLVRGNISFDKFFNFLNPSLNMFTHILNLASPYFSTDINYRISVIYNEYTGAAKYRTISKAIFPLTISRGVQSNIELSEYIYDTDPNLLLVYLERHLGVLSLYNAFLSSAASEHSTRFQMMESSSKNADRLSEELEIEVQFHRRQKITSEMQELAVGAGLLDK